MAEELNNGVPRIGPSEGTVAAKYAKLESKRNGFLSRAKECAALTLPSLMPKNDDDENAGDNPMPRIYNSLAAGGVKNVSNKLMLALFPPNTPFLKHQLDDFQVLDIATNAKGRGAVENGLAMYDRAIMMFFETTGLRVPLGLAMRHLIVTGNVLLVLDHKTGKGRAIRLKNYVVRRDPQGNWIELIIKERVAKVALPKDLREAAEKAHHEAGKKDGDELVSVYTRLWRKPDRYQMEQEVCGMIVEASKGSFKLDECPYIPLRLVSIDGEAYGRSFVEEHYGDIRTLELLSKAITQQAAVAAKIIFLRRPNATTKAKTIQDAESGDIVEGNIDDVKALQIDKYNDFQVVEKVIARIENRLSYAFMMASAIRDAERVTKEEVRRVIEELEGGMAGIHALLASELQLPLARILVGIMLKTKPNFPKLPKGAVQPMIVTGIEAIGRGNDLTNLRTALETIAILPKTLERINDGDLAERVFAAVNVPTVGLVTTDEQMQAQQQAAAAQALMQQAGPGMAQELTKGAVQGALANQQAGQPQGQPPAAPPHPSQ